MNSIRNCADYLTYLNDKGGLEGSSLDLFYESYETIKNDTSSIFGFYTYYISKLNFSNINSSFQSSIRELHFYLYLTKLYNKSVFQYNIIKVFLQRIQKELTSEDIYDKEETFLLFEMFIFNIPFIIPKSDNNCEKYIECTKEVKCILRLFVEKIDIYEKTYNEEYKVLVDSIQIYLNNSINDLQKDNKRSLALSEEIENKNEVSLLPKSSNEEIRNNLTTPSGKITNNNNLSIEEERELQTEETVMNLLSSINGIGEKKEVEYKSPVKTYVNNNTTNDAINDIISSNKIMINKQDINRSYQTKRRNKYDIAQDLLDRKENIALLVEELYQNKSSDDFNFDPSPFQDDYFSIQMIGSYTLCTVKSESSLIDLVLIPNTYDFDVKEPPEIIDWINHLNSDSRYKLCYEETINNFEAQAKDILFFSLYGEKIDKKKEVNLYLYRDKLVFCNNMISQLFQEESICCYLHSFFLDILKQYGYANGSEVCFLIIAFCDYKFNIFNTQHPIEQIFHVYKGNKILKEEKVYYYPFDNEQLKEVNQKDCIFDMIISFNQFIIDLLDENIDKFDRWTDKNYLFKISIFFKLAKMNGMNSKSLFTSVKSKLTSNTYYKYLSYDELYTSIIKNSQ